MPRHASRRGCGPMPAPGARGARLAVAPGRIGVGSLGEAPMTASDGTGRPPSTGCSRPHQGRERPIRTLEGHRDHTSARAARPNPPVERRTVGSWTTSWAPPRARSPVASRAWPAGGPRTPGQCLIAASTSAGTPAARAVAHTSTHEASANALSASAHSGSSPGTPGDPARGRTTSSRRARSVRPGRDRQRLHSAPTRPRGLGQAGRGIDAAMPTPSSVTSRPAARRRPGSALPPARGSLPAEASITADRLTVSKTASATHGPPHRNRPAADANVAAWRRMLTADGKAGSTQPALDSVDACTGITLEG